MSLSFGETTMTDDDEKVSKDEPVYKDQCRVAGCNNPVKAYGGRGKHPTKCEEHSTRATPGAGASDARWKTAMRSALEANGVGIGMLVMPFNTYDGQVIIQGTPRLADACVTWAETNPKVRRALQSFLDSAGVAGVVIALGGIVVPILANHGALPKSFLDAGTETSNV